jgi:hypothetical protein
VVRDPGASLLSQEVFEAARQQSERNARFSLRNRQYDYLFSGMTLRERAQALIEIAHPAFRETLTCAARERHLLA